jgi:hypothetical protein
LERGGDIGSGNGMGGGWGGRVEGEAEETIVNLHCIQRTLIIPSSNVSQSCYHQKIIIVGCFLQTKRYRVDGYEWKTRKTTKTVREDRMKLKVGGYQVCEIITSPAIYHNATAVYVH